MIFRIIVIALLGVILAMFLKTQKPEYSIFLSLCIASLILFCVLGLFTSAKEQLSTLSSYLTKDNQYFGLLFKMIGITYLSEFCSGICKDAGYQAIGSQIEVFGKLTILLAGLPILMTLIETIQGFAV
jgi:stage III sporulation protein AD